MSGEVAHCGEDRLTLRRPNSLKPLPMKIGLLQFSLMIDAAESIKDKRRVVMSVKDRLHREFMVSVAEIADLDVWNRASLGLAAVSADAAHLRQVLDSIVRKLKELRDARLGDVIADVVDVEDVVSFTDDDGTPLWTEHERRVEAEADAIASELLTAPKPAKKRPKRAVVKTPEARR